MFSVIKTTYERNKSPKLINKIFSVGLLPLITPDNVFEYYDNIFAVDTNTHKKTDISVCAVASILSDKASTAEKSSIDPLTGQMSVGRCSGNANAELEAIFAFIAQEHSPENLARHIIIESIRKSLGYLSGEKYAIIVDSDLGNMLAYNQKTSPYLCIILYQMI